MTVNDLIEGLRHNLGSIHNKQITEIEGTKFIVQITHHLADERIQKSPECIECLSKKDDCNDDCSNNTQFDYARGDVMLPKTLLTSIRRGINKMLKTDKMGSIDGLNDLLSKNKFIKIDINVKTKMKKSIFDSHSKRQKKIPTYSSILVSFEKMKFLPNTIKVVVITIFRPKTKRTRQAKDTYLQVEI